MSDTSDNSQTELLTPSMATPKQSAIAKHEVQSLENNENTTNKSNTDKNVNMLLFSQFVIFYNYYIFNSVHPCMHAHSVKSLIQN